MVPIYLVGCTCYRVDKLISDFVFFDDAPIFNPVLNPFYLKSKVVSSVNKTSLSKVKKGTDDNYESPICHCR